ncbi:hypothetical protein NPIL_432051 [Nephila pilipes]|uniref:Uncharacterized protein n=1 Tax=Nephila pilipes TaxID=299642 RepID=A0A8X6U769_NEPPI|nr:hypothetical protein NPIL_432051 [Nephila pilipes]
MASTMNTSETLDDTNAPPTIASPSTKLAVEEKKLEESTANPAATAVEKVPQLSTDATPEENENFFAANAEGD